MNVRKLINSGSNCYLNSALQGISSCPIFIKEIALLAGQHSDVKELKDFNDLLNALNESNDSKIDARQNELFKNWKKFGQQDSFELLSYAINEVYNKLRKILNLTDLEKWLRYSLPMRIIVVHELKCNNNHIIKCPVQAMLALHVPIIGKKNSVYDIQSLVDKYLTGNEIEDYVCDECESTKTKESVSTGSEFNDIQRDSEKSAKKSSTSHITSLVDAEIKHPKGIQFVYIEEPLPKTICIQLQRTRCINKYMEKVNNEVKINETLVIRYQSNGQNVEQSYLLKSVIVHSGTTDFGHYICYKNLNGYWCYTSDSFIRRSYKMKSVPDCQAYILFYEISDCDSPE